MGSRTCMNTLCGATSTSQWKKGWTMKSGQIVDLCAKCGSSFEKLAYCDTFHTEETGWRECSLCNKRLHCGCSASASFIEVQDFGGVWCINCAQSASCHLIRRERVLSEAQKQRTFNYGELPTAQVNNKLDGETLSGGSLLRLGNITENKEPIYMTLSHTEHANASTAVPIHLKAENSMGIVGIDFTNLSQSPAFSKPGDDKLNMPVIKDMHEPQIQPLLNISLSSPTQNLDLALPVSGGDSVEDGGKGRQSLPLHQTPGTGQRPRHILPKPSPKSNFSKGSDVSTTTSNKGSGSQMRIARPPAEGRLRNQLLPRYWPRITDQELQELSGDLNSTIVPLFEKVLSASDASRIGRLVLPKACAEAYFPPINQSEGLPLKIQDVKGNEWTFQFRFWPNNNSRMYVLEGVTPCIQSMHLQAGDTVMFSRIDPGGKLVMGFRKSSISVEAQDPLPSSSSHNDVSVPGESSRPDVTDGQATTNGYSSLLQPLKGSKENNGIELFERSNMKSVDTGWNKNEKIKGKLDEDSLPQPGISSDKKRSRNIGSKSKRLLMHNEDALELKISWEETQDLLRPPPSIQPNVIRIEDFEFEEYSEPPVFGKRTLFTTMLSGGQDQWVQCDKCAKWRKLPIYVLLPPKWSCSDNIWDLSRSSCSVPDESGSKGLYDILRAGKDLKKRRVTERTVVSQGNEEPCGLDALATVAALGDDEEVSAAAATVTTTRHPRHRPGCTCIVCIQPPSGKGKHKPNCVCNVCSTVKRRFKTLMMRKKKRQSEREAAAESIGQQQPQQQKKKYNQQYHPATIKEEKSHNMSMDIEEAGSSNKDAPEEGEESSGSKETLTATAATTACTTNIDLNCHPNREEESQLQLQLQADRSDLNIPLGCMNLGQNQLNSSSTSASASASASATASSSVLLQQQQHRVKEQIQTQPSEGDQSFQPDEKSGQHNGHQEEAASH